MTIALPGASKRGLAGLLARKRSGNHAAATAADKKSRTPMKPQEIARRFAQEKQGPAKPARPAKLNDSEKQDRARLSSLRGALYSND